jgi:hypothetical protein
LGLKDFYSLHVLAFCEGSLNEDGHRNVMSCSDRTAPFAFNPARVFSTEFQPGFNVSDIDWPETITDDFTVMETTTKAMSVLYIIGVASTGITFLMEILLTQAGGRPSMIAHLLFTVVCNGVSLMVLMHRADIPLLVEFCVSGSLLLGSFGDCCPVRPAD